MVITAGNIIVEVRKSKKNISKDQVIETAVELIKDKQDTRSVNLREIARVLGCAHTNLYNYFPSFNDLLWEVHIAIQARFIEEVSLRLTKIQDAELRLQCFFATFIDIYLSHIGWFRLEWFDYIGENRPERNKTATEKMVYQLVDILTDIWIDLYHDAPDRKKMNRILHNVHCYIIGEVSNFINGRRLIHDETELKNYVLSTSISIFKLCLREEI